MELKGNATYIEQVLRDLGFEKIHRKKDGFMALCRFHNEKDRSFSISDTGLWFCWSCHVKGNLKQLMEKLGGAELDWRDMLKVMGASLSDFDKPKKSKRIANLPEDFSPYTFEAEVPEVIAKRLHWETIQAFGLGYCLKYPNEGRCIIPIKYKGKVVGYHGRAIKDSKQPRYYNPSEFEIKDYLFNYDACGFRKELILVEGAFNAMSMAEKGFLRTAATFGTEFKSEQVQKIFSLNPSSVVICFDRDPSKIKEGKEHGFAGQRATKKLGLLLNDFLKVEVMPLPFGKDPNDLPAEILGECYRRRVPFDSLIGETK